jgi:flavodoxin
MRAKEFLKEAEAAAAKKLGRAFNHLEDLVFFHGSQGTMEALEHVREIASEAGSKTVRMKWDGNPQIYWGREVSNGPLVLAGHNGWSRGAITTSPEEVADFIANQSGSPKTPEEKAQRDAFAQQFANLYPLFDAATPKDFVGFVYADGLFLQTPELDQDGVYNFCPNPKSKTCYHVRADSDLGKRIAQAQVMVVGHAYFPEFGMDDSAQKPIDDFSQFNSNPALIVQGPVYNSAPVKVGDAEITAVETYLQSHAQEIDAFLQGTAGLGDLKNILYTYVNQTAKAKQLDNLGSNQFFNWLKTSKVSANKQAKIQELSAQSPNALPAIFGLVKQIMTLKDQVIAQIESGAQGEIWDTEGEGRVRYASAGKQFGNVKLVPRKRWTPT